MSKRELVMTTIELRELRSLKRELAFARARAKELAEALDNARARCSNAEYSNKVLGTSVAEWKKRFDTLLARDAPPA